jgi:aspartate oxidase
MAYDYDRTAGTLDSIAQAANMRNGILGKASQELDRLDKRGVNFDTRDRKKLELVSERILKVGDVSAKAANRIFDHRVRNEAAEIVLGLLETHLREWEAAKTEQLVAYRRIPTVHMQVFNAKASAAAAGWLNIDLIDFANAIAFNNPDMESVAQAQFRSFG